MKPPADFFFKKMRAFIDSVKEGVSATVPSSQIVINQAIIDGIVKSAKLGKEIEINIPEV
jgi:oxidoreductase domain-containing protein